LSPTSENGTDYEIEYRLKNTRTVIATTVKKQQFLILSQ